MTIVSVPNEIVDFSEETVSQNNNNIAEKNEETNEQDNEEATDTEQENIEYTFSYDSINQDNYVNFVEQLCSIDFTQNNVDISNIPVDTELLQYLQEVGCVSQLCLDYGFITTDSGFNDETNTFYLVLHTPNQDKNYILVEGVINNGYLIELFTTKME